MTAGSRPRWCFTRRTSDQLPIWAFGCVLYEMLSGRAAFGGDTVSDSIAKVLEREPDWSALPDAVPAGIRRLLRRCLTKDSKQRLRDIGDARIEIDAVITLPSSDETSAAKRRRRSRMWQLPLVALVAVTAGVAVRRARRPTVTENPFVTAQFSALTD